MRGAILLALSLAAAQPPPLSGTARFEICGCRPSSRDAVGYSVAAVETEGGCFSVTVTVASSPQVPAGNLAAEMASAEAKRTLIRVMRAISLDPYDEGSQDALSVLKRGKARCEGLANATVSLLEEAGIQARTVSGLLVSGGQVLGHRWVEVNIPGAGWVPTDPTLGVWLISTGHVPLERGGCAHMPRVSVVGLEPQTTKLGRCSGFPCKALVAAELRLVGAGNGGDPVEVALDGPAGERLVGVAGKREIRFGGLLPGWWRVTIDDAGRKRELKVRLEEGVIRVLPVAVASGG